MGVHYENAEDALEEWRGIPLYGKGREAGEYSVVRDYPDVFLEEFPGLYLERGVEFYIDLVSDTSPKSRASYRMTLTELQELKNQL